MNEVALKGFLVLNEKEMCKVEGGVGPVAMFAIRVGASIVGGAIIRAIDGAIEGATGKDIKTHA
ncbi:class IIb bacteriocin, lactobin A/cerein 7B family [Caldicellulosiruptor acetigenus]|nr:class IIb bacteriocin, lactobin A/cerein 7B family [Caldicellulosiruptor acetigenus]AEM73630.1 short chain dehydrogenase/reductase family oxidoreductase [Caldicellulosiruptor acetigenus 6A]